jgi:predicted DNA-binding transcriptional regulator YafY
MDVIRAGCWHEEALFLRYADKDGTVTERTVLPLSVVYLDSKMTLLAWCCLREAFRMFRLDRVREVRAAGTSFRPRRVALLRGYLAELRAGRPFVQPPGSPHDEPT